MSKMFVLCLAIAAAAIGGQSLAADDESKAPSAEPAAAPPAIKPGGSQLAADNNMCFQCHSEPDLWDEKTKHLHMPKGALADDAHWRKGVNCHDCHGGDAETDQVNVAHASENGFRPRPALRQVCGLCHENQSLEMFKGVHAKAGPKDAQGRGTILDCQACHGDNVHHILPATDSRAPVFLDHQVELCGKCHEDDQASYAKSVHGWGLYSSGLLVTASCANCHGAHGIYRAPDERSTLHPTKVAETCGKCHRFIEDRLQKSIHGRGKGLGQIGERAAAGGKEHRTATCTSCHQGHDLADPKTAAFRQELPHRCGNCHTDLSRYYSMGVHGQLAELGYVPAAKCSDCHGGHDVLPAMDPGSPLHSDHRVETCRKCHPYANVRFAAYDPHADHTDRARDPFLYWIYTGLMTLLITTFTVFGLHAVLWLVRGLFEVRQHGRPRALVPGEQAYMRFSHYHRLAHTFLLISFLGLTVTGLPLKYSHYDWAKTLARVLGGFESTSTWHRVFALVTFGCFVVYLFRMALRYYQGWQQGHSFRALVFGPDSPVPNLRDARDMLQMFGWFFGLTRKPTFERWTYWEKFDFWGAMTDVVIIGFTGLILWFPSLFCLVLPGAVLNVAKVIHSTQALLATGFVFAIHFFATHFRPEKFPMDMSILSGLVSAEEMEHERPDFVARMRREGKLESLLATVPARKTLWLLRLGGFVALSIGLALLLAIIITALGA